MQGCQASTTALLGGMAGPHSSWTCPREPATSGARVQGHWLAPLHCRACLDFTCSKDLLNEQLTGAFPFSQVFLTNEYLGIAMEYAPGGDMFQYVKQRNGLQVSPLAAMVMRALPHL